ncbi:putative reverse transcriptase domain-containing protein [Tanacetum coccineum]
MALSPRVPGTFQVQALQTILSSRLSKVTNKRESMLITVMEEMGLVGNGNGGNNGCTFKAFQSCNPKEYDGKGGAIVLTHWIEKMENVIDNSGCAENQKVSNEDAVWAAMAMTWNDFKALMVKEFYPSNEIEKLENEFWNHKMEDSLERQQEGTTNVGAQGLWWIAPLRNEVAKRKIPECSKSQVTPVNAVRMSNNPRVCYECGSPDHFRNTCPKMNRAPGQAGNPLALEGSRNNRSNGNQVRGRAYHVNVADFSFISTEFAPLLNVRPSIVNPGYVIEVADGKKVEVGRIIRDYKLELGGSLLSINLISLGHGSFDMIVGMDWLSQHKAVIVCHEKTKEHHEVLLGLGVGNCLRKEKLYTGKIEAVYYKNFFQIAKPLTSLTQKNQKYVWGVEQEEAFQTLKNNLCDAPILTLPDGVEDFVVYCDASNQGLGYVLMQRGKYEIHYHLSKANVVADALSRKEQLKPRRMEKKEGKSCISWDRIWVPLVGSVRTMIMDEAHRSKYSVHPGADKMYHDLRDMYWWPGMKRDIATYVSKCLTCSKRWTIYIALLADCAKSFRDEVGYEYGLSSPKGLGKGKLASRYVGPFEIVAYQLRLPEELSGVHDTFHVSNLKKCLADDSLHMPLDEINVDKNFVLLRTWRRLWTMKIIREVFVKLLLDSFGKLSISLYDSTLYVLLCYVLFITVIGFKGELHENTEDREILFLYCYAFSVSLLLTPLCCDNIHDVTPRVSALAGCDRLVSEPMVIES